MEEMTLPALSELRGHSFASRDQMSQSYFAPEKFGLPCSFKSMLIGHDMAIEKHSHGYRGRSNLFDIYGPSHGAVYISGWRTWGYCMYGGCSLKTR